MGKPKVNPSKSTKNPYTKPRLILHGKVDEITESGGGLQIDLPQGTTINPDDTIANVTS